jgi:pimeloyl-ACP methyl ester carboxylesterase
MTSSAACEPPRAGSEFMKTTVQGHPAYVYTGGRAFNPAQPVVVLIHGAQHDHSVWIMQSRWLAHHGYSVLVPDLPGHGRSAGPLCTDIAEMARWILDLLQTLGVERAVLAGHSMGSLISLEAAALAPQRCRGLGLIGTAFPMKVSPALLEAARDREPEALDMINRFSHARWVHPPGTPGPGFSVFVQNLRLMQRQAPGVLLNDFRACDTYADGLTRAAALSCPVLFVLGERDAMTPPKAARPLIAACSQASVCQVPQAGHALMSETPEAVRIALSQWLSSLPD